MSYILTTIYPIDDGHTAAHYAASLALALNLPLRLVYPYTVPIAVGEMPMPMLPVDDVRDAAQARLTTVAAELSTHYPSLELTTDVAYGNLEDVLDDIDEVPMLTVIGNNEPEETDVWLGSESAAILREGRWPVLAVPHGSKFSTPQQVCLACDAKTIQEGLPLGNLLSLQQHLGFKLTVLHVMMHDEPTVSYEGSALDAQLAGRAGYAEVSANAEVNAAIAAYADTHGMDWLALAPHHYGFWAGLFHKSHTSRVLHLAHVPVLAMH